MNTLHRSLISCCRDAAASFRGCRLNERPCRRRRGRERGERVGERNRERRSRDPSSWYLEKVANPLLLIPFLWNLPILHLSLLLFLLCLPSLLNYFHLAQMLLCQLLFPLFLLRLLLYFLQLLLLLYQFILLHSSSFHSFSSSSFFFLPPFLHIPFNWVFLALFLF